MAKAKTTKATGATKAKKMADVRPMTDDQIDKRLVELAKEQMNLRFQKASGQLENAKAFLPLRKEAARLKTEQSARRLAAAKPQKAAPKKSAAKKSA